jgi:hypothetical protein
MSLWNWAANGPLVHPSDDTRNHTCTDLGAKPGSNLNITFNKMKIVLRKKFICQLSMYTIFCVSEQLHI